MRNKRQRGGRGMQRGMDWIKQGNTPPYMKSLRPKTKNNNNNLYGKFKDRKDEIKYEGIFLFRGRNF